MERNFNERHTSAKPLHTLRANAEHGNSSTVKTMNMHNSVTSTKCLNVASATATVRRVPVKPLNTTKSKVTSSNIITKSESDKKARESIQRQTTLNTISRTNAYRTTVSKGNSIHTCTKTNASLAVAAKNTVKDNLRNQDDRTATVTMAVTAGEVAVKTFKTSQNLTPHIVNSVIKTGKDVYNVGGKSVKVIKTVDSTVARLQTGQLQLNHDTYLQLKAVAKCKIRNTAPVQRLTHAVNRIHTGVSDTVDTARYISTATKYYYQSVKYGAIRTAKVTRGVLNGTVKLKVDKNTLAAMKNISLKGLKKGGIVVGRTLKTGTEIGLKTAWGSSKFVVTKGHRGIRGGYRGLKTGIIKAGDLLSQQDDMGAQALGMGIKTARYTIRTAKATPKIAGKTIKTAVAVPVKTAKGILAVDRAVGRFAYSVKTFGIKTTLAMHRAKAMKAFRKAGGSVVSAMLDGAKKFLMKALMPLIIILLLIFVCVNVIVSSGAGAYQILFGWTSTNKDTGEDVDEQVWLTQKITASRTQLVEDIKNKRAENLKSGGGQYDYVRFFNSISDTEIDLTDTNILSSVYSLNEYYEYIQPIFHVMLLSKYELEATEAEMTDLYNEIWNKLTVVTTTELPMEYCNGGTKEADNILHADITTCPNHSDIQYHSDDLSSAACSCDYNYWTCLGHRGKLNCGKKEHTHNDSCYDKDKKLTCTKEEHTHSAWSGKDNAGCYGTDYCSSDHMTSACGNSEKHNGCNGYYICNGHKILAINVSVGSFSDLMNSYFLNRINELEGKGSLTEDETTELENLKENYEICMSYLENVNEELGLGSGTVVELDDVTLTQVTEFACRFIGNPYVYGGEDINNGIDCSAFVRYVYSNFGVTLPRTSREQVLCGVEVSSLADAKAGDLIFYSKNGTDNGVYHVTMYLGNGKMVHASNSKPYPQGGIKVSNVYGAPYKIRRVAN